MLSVAGLHLWRGERHVLRGVGFTAGPGQCVLLTGKNGAGLSFDGTSASVNLGGLGTFYQAGFTLEAWVKKTSASANDRAVVGTWSGSGGPMVWNG